jgi:hypothetical protein
VSFHTCFILISGIIWSPQLSDIQRDLKPSPKPKLSYGAPVRDYSGENLNSVFEGLSPLRDLEVSRPGQRIHIYSAALRPVGLVAFICTYQSCSACNSHYRQAVPDDCVGFCGQRVWAEFVPVYCSCVSWICCSCAASQCGTSAQNCSACDGCT